MSLFGGPCRARALAIQFVCLVFLLLLFGWWTRPRLSCSISFRFVVANFCQFMCHFADCSWVHLQGRKQMFSLCEGWGWMWVLCCWCVWFWDDFQIVGKYSSPLRHLSTCLLGIFVASAQLHPTGSCGCVQVDIHFYICLNCICNYQDIFVYWIGLSPLQDTFFDLNAVGTKLRGTWRI